MEEGWVIHLQSQGRVSTWGHWCHCWTLRRVGFPWSQMVLPQFWLPRRDSTSSNSDTWGSFLLFLSFAGLDFVHLCVESWPGSCTSTLGIHSFTDSLFLYSCLYSFLTDPLSASTTGIRLSFYFWSFSLTQKSSIWITSQTRERGIWYSTYFYHSHDVMSCA